jgi:hypothetical protein
VLASYAKMADDDSLRQLADRIQARAVRRMGELYKTFNAQGQRTDKLIDGTVNKLTQKEVRKSEGISERQAATAVRVANVPTEKFEAAIEQPKPATVTELSEMGKKIRAAPDSFKQATHLIGAVTRFAEFCRTTAPEPGATSLRGGVTVAGNPTTGGRRIRVLVLVKSGAGRSSASKPVALRSLRPLDFGNAKSAAGFTTCSIMVPCLSTRKSCRIRQGIRGSSWRDEKRRPQDGRLKSAKFADFDSRFCLGVHA